MTGFTLVFEPSKPPIYLANLYNHATTKYPDNYDMRKQIITTEIHRYGGIVNPLFASNYGMTTIYFKDKKGFDSFVSKWG